MARGPRASAVSLALAAGLSALAAWGIVGCADSVSLPAEHQSLDPETELTFAPIENDTTSFRVHIYWSGTDRDGEVVRFYFAIDADTVLATPLWKSTTAKDTTLVLPVDSEKASAAHAFMISAVDNLGRYDHTPAKRLFSSRTVPPISKIESGPAAFNPRVEPSFTFRWSGVDPDGSPTGHAAAVDSFQYLLLHIGAAAELSHPVLPFFDQALYVDLINRGTGPTLPAPHDDWKWIGIRGSENRFANVAAGDYVFAERAVDIAGAVERPLRIGVNIRNFTVIFRPPSPPQPMGPDLAIRTTALPLSLAGAKGPADAPRKALQILEGETVEFTWNASAASYGGTIVGYTYVLDDSTRLPALSLLATHVTFTQADLPAGLHFLYIRAVDDRAQITSAIIPIQSIHATFKDPGAPREILYVDDSLSPGGTTARVGNFPSDGEETSWWTLKLLPQLGVPFTEWDTNLAALGDVEGRKAPQLSDLANYSTVIWNVDFNNGVSNPTALWKALTFRGLDTGLYGYLHGGGTLILTGFAIASNTCDPRTTLTANATRGICAALEPGSADYNLSYFPRTIMGVDGALANDQGLRTLGARDFIEAAPTGAGIAAGYDSAQIDSGSPGSGVKWMTWDGTGDPNLNSSPGLPLVDGWIMATDFGCTPDPAGTYRPEDPTRAIAEPIFIYHGVNRGISEEGAPSPREGTVVGVQVQAHGMERSRDSYGYGGFDPRASYGRMVHLGFPLYFLRDPDAARVLQAAFNYVNASPTLP